VTAPVDVVRDALEARDRRPRGPAYNFTACCPVPDHGRGRGDRSPSLGVREGVDGRALLLCRAGCSTEDVLAALGLSFVDLFPDGHRRGRRAKPLPPARPGHLKGPFGAAIDYIAALAQLDQNATISVMAPRCFACEAQGAWLRADRHGVTLDCPEGCDGGAVAGALARTVAEHG
jgi:hypothetical protein